MNKSILREVYRRIRLAMSAAEVKTKSRIICRKLLTDIDWQKVENACVYSPIARLNEVDIAPLASIPKKHSIKVHQLGSSRSESTPNEKFDLILVPCLAFDKQNYRLGWGGGFYDKFLASQPQALKIGLCFANGLVAEGLPIEPHDVKLDMIITEERIYRHESDGC